LQRQSFEGSLTQTIDRSHNAGASRPEVAMVRMTRVMISTGIKTVQALGTNPNNAPRMTNVLESCVLSTIRNEPTNTNAAPPHRVVTRRAVASAHRGEGSVRLNPARRSPHRRRPRERGRKNCGTRSTSKSSDVFSAVPSPSLRTAEHVTHRSKRTPSAARFDFGSRSPRSCHFSSVKEMVLRLTTHVATVGPTDD